MDNISLSAPLPFRTAFNRFGGFCIPMAAEHRVAAQVVIGGGVWEPDTIAYMADAGAGREVVHAGTFFGDFLPGLGAVSKVWAFEPNRENWRCAHLTCRLNRLTNVELFFGALSDGEGQRLLQVADETGLGLGGASRIVPSDAAGRTETTPVTRLDQIVPGDRDIAVIQLDVEGHEAQALAGALQTIRRCRPVLILETPPARWIAENLAPLGYTERLRLHDNTVFRAD